MDPDDRCCRFGCNSLEDGQHILLECPKFDAQRRILIQGFEQLCLELTLDNLLGTNGDLSSKTHFKIHKLISAFIANGGLPAIL